MNTVKPLLTIAIPTYKRAAFLDRCLDSIASQLHEVAADDIEIIIANNASPDNTDEIVRKHQNNTTIAYFKNEVNGGPDATSSLCFKKANGKYVWVLGDDEILVQGSLKIIYNLLKDNDYGDVYISCIPFHRDEEAKFEAVDQAESIIFTDPIKFINQIHYYITFISGNIINKSIIPANFDYDRFMHTNIVQVGWTMKAVFEAHKNLFVSTPLIAAKQNNSGGYQFVTTFAKNYNFILQTLVNDGFDRRILDITNVNLIRSYFPANIIKLLYYENRFSNENHFKVLFNAFWKYKDFWTILYPIYLKYWLKRASGFKINRIAN